MSGKRLVQIILIALVGLGQADARRPDRATPPEHSQIYELASADPGRRLRGDWEPPDVLFLAFTDAWPEVLADLVAVVSSAGQTQVELLVDPNTYPDETVQQWMDAFDLPADALRIIPLPIDTPWVRDYGPFEVRTADGDRVWLDGDYAPPRPNDDAVPPALAALFGVRFEPLAAPLEGGALISNGRGLCVMTAEYIVENGVDLDEAQPRDALLGQMGCREIAAVPALADERTHHADMLAQFLAPDLVAVADVSRVESAEDAARMDEAARGIEEAARRQSLDLHVVRVPLPYLGEGRYRTYLNGVRLSTELVVPSYRDVPDTVEASAYRILSQALPGTNVVAVPADDVIQHLGSLHCITAGVSPAEPSCPRGSDPVPGL
jgi:agmatine/peptidylarginine deiminase